MVNSKEHSTVNFHIENISWERELEIWKKSLFDFQNQLNKIIHAWPNDEQRPQLDKFNNQFIRHIEDIKELILHIEDHEDQLIDKSKSSYNQVSQYVQTVHFNLRARKRELQKEHEELKKAYFEYLRAHY